MLPSISHKFSIFHWVLDQDTDLAISWQRPFYPSFYTNFNFVAIFWILKTKETHNIFEGQRMIQKEKWFKNIRIIWIQEDTQIRANLFLVNCVKTVCLSVKQSLICKCLMCSYTSVRQLKSKAGDFWMKSIYSSKIK